VRELETLQLAEMGVLHFLLLLAGELTAVYATKLCHWNPALVQYPAANSVLFQCIRITNNPPLVNLSLKKQDSLR
jgi:hypothetical protein